MVVAGLAIFYFMRDKSTSEKVTPTENESRNFRPDPSNATFIIDDEKITLSKGQEITSTEETSLLDKFAYGDINGDGKVDTALFLVQSGGGSGTFIYLGAYISGPVNYKGSNTVFIGDRISPQSISVSKGVITVKYLERKENEPLAAEPTVSVTKQFVYTNGELVEK